MCVRADSRGKRAELPYPGPYPLLTLWPLPAALIALSADKESSNSACNSFASEMAKAEENVNFLNKICK